MEAFQPFGLLQSVKLLRDKGGERPPHALRCMQIISSVMR